MQVYMYSFDCWHCAINRGRGEIYGLEKKKKKKKKKQRVPPGLDWLFASEEKKEKLSGREVGKQPNAPK